MLRARRSSGGPRDRVSERCPAVRAGEFAAGRGNRRLSIAERDAAVSPALFGVARYALQIALLVSGLDD